MTQTTLKLFSPIILLLLTLTVSGQENSQLDTITYTMADTVEAIKLIDEAILASDKAQFDIALNKMEQAKTMCVNIYGEKSEKVAGCWQNIGYYLFQLGRYQESKKAFDASLITRINLFGENHLRVAVSYKYLGIVVQYLSGDFTSALEYHNRALKIRQNILGDDHILVGESYGEIGAVLLNTGQYIQARDYTIQALELREKHLGSKHLDVATSLMNLGVCENYLGNYKNAISNLKQALEIQGIILGEDHPTLGATYNNLGLSYLNKGDFGKAIQFYQKALSIRTKKLGEDHPLLFNSYNNMGIGYARMGDFKTAKQYYEKGHDLIIKTMGKEHPRLAYSFINLGGICADLKLFDQAITYTEEGLRQTIQFFGPEHVLTGYCYGNFANSYISKDTSKALDYNRKHIELALKLHGNSHPELAEAYRSLGINLAHVEKYSQSEKALKKSLKVLKYTNTDSLNNISSAFNLHQVLKTMGDLYHEWGALSNDLSLLKKSRESYKKAVDVINYQMYQSNPAARSSLASEASILFFNGIRNNLILNSLNKNNQLLAENFSFAERSKAFLLYEAMQESEALQIAGIPDSLLQREYDLRIDIAYYDKKKQEKINNGLIETDTSVLEIAGKLFDLNREYEVLKQNFESNYPQYYKAKYDLSTISLDKVQKEILHDNQSIIEYMVGDSSIFIFLIQKENYVVKEIKRDFPLEDWVRAMTKDGIYGYYASPITQRNPATLDQSIADYTQSAQQLYNKIIAPIADQLTEELIIIPDGVLGYIPFEALIEGAPKREGIFRSYPFLLEKHQISYCYSATLLQEMQQKVHPQKPGGELLAMAPFFQGDIKELFNRIDSTDLLALRDSLSALPASGEEVAALNNIIKGKASFGTEANLPQFEQLAPRYRMLHLSTHGKADDRVGDYAFLAFSNSDKKGTFEKLYARDLYNYQLNADMVVLSACETGIGKLQKGEGIISLARAFAYAGAKSIFTTLWQVSDEKTKELMVYFYQNLKAGQAKDEALRNAKLKYLKNNQGEAQHPFFWASMIGIGDMNALSFEK